MILGEGLVGIAVGSEGVDGQLGEGFVLDLPEHRGLSQERIHSSNNILNASTAVIFLSLSQSCRGRLCKYRLVSRNFC